jgi:RsiW-degrading membrane proteinase PrsW (M82 family)
MGLFLSIFFGFMPMLVYAWFVYWLDRYEKEPVHLIGIVFVWGAVVAAGAAYFINTILGIGVYLFTESERLAELTTGSLVAPVVEESLKGLAVLGIFLLYRIEFDSVLDGIIYAGITALGFAATENSYYIYQHGYLADGYSGLFRLVLIRVILVGWQHPFYTAFIGISIALARIYRQGWIRLLAPLAGWLIAVFLHSFHNTLASFLNGAASLLLGAIVDWTGWLFMFCTILIAITQEQRTISTQLVEEVQLGHLDQEQYQTACSALRQSRARLMALFTGKFRMVNRFYQITAELAHKKHQLQQIGDERGNLAIIQKLRGELISLAPAV